MGEFEPIVFDLDGTIADTRPGIVAAVERLLEEFHQPMIAGDRLHRFMGRGLDALMEGILAEIGRSNTSPDERRAFRARYEELYASTCTSACPIYSGMRDILDHLTVPIGLATNKSRQFTIAILTHLGLDRRFGAIVAGDDVDRTALKPSGGIIKEVLRRLGGGRMPILVGDTDADVLSGKAAGIATCAVGWGYGPIRETHPTYRAATPAELCTLLCGPRAQDEFALSNRGG